MGHEPRNVQVIVSTEDARLFLVSDDGVISAKSEHVSNNSDEIISHNTNESVNESSVHELESLRSALRKACLKNEQFQEELLHRDQVVEELRQELSTAKAEVERLTAAAEVPATELETFHKELKVQTAKPKRLM